MTPTIEEIHAEAKRIAAETGVDWRYWPMRLDGSKTVPKAGIE